MTCRLGIGCSIHLSYGCVRGARPLLLVAGEELGHWLLRQQSGERVVGEVALVLGDKRLEGALGVRLDFFGVGDALKDGGAHLALRQETTLGSALVDNSTVAHLSIS